MSSLQQNPLFPVLVGLGVAVLLGLAAVVFLLGMVRKLRRDRLAVVRRLENLQNQLNQARRMEAVGILAGSIVHNLNNLLAVILGHSRMAMRELPSDSPLVDDLEKVNKAGHMAGELVLELSDFYRQADQALKPTDLVPVVSDTLKLLRDILPPTVDIREDLPHRLGPVMASPTGVPAGSDESVQQFGAGHSSPAGHHRGLPQGRAHRGMATGHSPGSGPGSYVMLTVRDNGRGMDQETLDRIFKSYFSGSDEGRGMGIGLSTVHRILRDHDGVTIPHSSPGRGTSFDIYFPMIAWKVEQPERRRAWSKPRSTVTPVVEEAAEASPTLVEADRRELKTLAGGKETSATSGELDDLGDEVTVLLVDDQEMVAQVTSRGLQRQGFRVITHTDGRRALDDFVQTPQIFDVVVTDQIMPHISGVRLTRRIRGVRPDIPVILITGFRDSFNEKQAKEAGVTEFVMKPTSHRDLAALIRRVLLRSLEEKA